jgi:hypothetical protein
MKERIKAIAERDYWCVELCGATESHRKNLCYCENGNCIKAQQFDALEALVNEARAEGAWAVVDAVEEVSLYADGQGQDDYRTTGQKCHDSGVLQCCSSVRAAVKKFGPRPTEGDKDLET